MSEQRENEQQSSGYTCPWCGYFLCCYEEVPLSGVRRQCEGCGSWVFLGREVLSGERGCCPCCGLVIVKRKRRCPRCGMKVRRGLLWKLRRLFPRVSAPPVRYVAVEKIHTDNLRARRAIDVKRFEVLLHSIDRFGILCPLVVRPSGSGYDLISGHRRLLAAQKLGLREVPVVVRHVREEERNQLRLIDNLTGEPLSDVDLAELLKENLTALGPRKDKKLLQLLNLSAAEARRLLKVLNLPDLLKDALSLGIVTEEEARKLAQNQSPEEILVTLQSQRP